MNNIINYFISFIFLSLFSCSLIKPISENKTMTTFDQVAYNDSVYRIKLNEKYPNIEFGCAIGQNVKDRTSISYSLFIHLAEGTNISNADKDIIYNDLKRRVLKVPGLKTVMGHIEVDSVKDLMDFNPPQDRPFFIHF